MLAKCPAFQRVDSATREVSWDFFRFANLLLALAPSPALGVFPVALSFSQTIGLADGRERHFCSLTSPQGSSPECLLVAHASLALS